MSYCCGHLPGANDVVSTWLCPACIDEKERGYAQWRYDHRKEFPKHYEHNKERDRREFGIGVTYEH